MRNVFCFLFVLSMSCPLFGQVEFLGEDSLKFLQSSLLTKKEIKQFDKFAGKIGLIKYSEVKDKDSKDFWNYIAENNLRHNKFMEAFNKGTKMAKNAVEEVNDLVVRAQIKRPSMEFVVEGAFNDTINELENYYKSYLSDGNIDLQLINDDSMNAFATPDGYIGINMGCFIADWITDNERLYIVGHEYAHVRLAHRVVHKYFQKKQNFKMNMIAGISSAVIAAGAVYEAALGVTDTTAVKSIDKIITSTNELKEDFYFKFSREEEFEADVYSMYYLMNKGISPFNAIMHEIKCSEQFGDKETEKDDSHPSFKERAKFLLYVLTEYNIDKDNGNKTKKVK